MKRKARGSVKLVEREKDEDEHQNDEELFSQKKARMGNSSAKRVVEPETPTKSSNQSAADSKDTHQSTTSSPLGNLEVPFDVDQSNSKCMHRFKANKQFRESGCEKLLAKNVLGNNWETRYNLLIEGRCPLSFPDEETFLSCISELTEILISAGISDGWVGLRGSSATFLSMHPEKGIDPDVPTVQKEFEDDNSLKKSLSELHYFDCKVIQRGGYSAVEKLSEYEAFQLYSDLDFNIKSRALISKLQKKARSRAVKKSEIITIKTTQWTQFRSCGNSSLNGEKNFGET